MDAELVSFRRGIAKGIVTASVEGKIACKAELTMGIPEIIAQFNPKSNLTIEGCTVT
jgi:3-hydroxyacyl-[acyl-carrier-protein] dehydratase